MVDRVLLADCQKERKLKAGCQKLPFTSVSPAYTVDP